VLNKIDLVQYLPFDEAEFGRLVQGLNPGVPVLSVSSTEGTGILEWTTWLANQL
jgi:Ni2+-binding GTPase involved in maturation of urease and hydrogenase